MYFKIRIPKTANQYQCCHNCKLYPENYFDISIFTGYMEQKQTSKQKPKVNVYLVHG